MKFVSDAMRKAKVANATMMSNEFWNSMKRCLKIFNLILRLILVMNSISIYGLYRWGVVHCKESSWMSTRTWRRIAVLSYLLLRTKVEIGFIALFTWQRGF